MSPSISNLKKSILSPKEKNKAVKKVNFSFTSDESPRKASTKLEQETK